MSVTLEEVDKAIQNILEGGQSLTLSDGTRYEQANLKSLMALKDRLSTPKTRAQLRFRNLYQAGETWSGWAV